MRSRSSVAAFVRLCAASALGVYLGASVAGLVAVVSGDVFSPGSRWLTDAPALAVIGAGVGVAVTWLTRRWLTPRAPRRLPVFAVAGALTLPLFVAISEFRAVETVAVPMALVGAAVTAVVYWRASYSTMGSR